MPKLNELTLSELTVLHHRIGVLCEAGRSLDAANLGPVFDLTPGAPISIYTNAVMPALEDYGQHVQFSMEVSGPEVEDLKFPGIATIHFAEKVADRAFERDIGLDTDIPSFLKRESTEAPPTSPASEPVDPPPALGEVVGGGAPTVDQPGPPAGAEISAEPSRPAEADAVAQYAAEAGAEAESGGGAEVTAPEAPAATDAKPQPEPWSAAEDSTLIHTVVDLMVNQGMARKPAATEASKLLPGRTADACIYRAHTKAKEAINAAVAEAAVRQAQTETPEIPAAEVRPDPEAEGDAAVGGHSPAAVQTDDLTAHLLGLTDKGGWSLQRDTDLMELSIAGWPAGEIALEIRMQANAIKPRFDALTGMHDDEATGKKVRRWTREQVLDRLQALGKARSAA